MKKQLFLFVMILLPMVASADAVGIDGIYYNFYSMSKSAEVTSNPFQYSGDVVIPESVTYQDVNYNVTVIGFQAFRGCKDLTSITVPNSVTEIGIAAFENCSGLTSVTIGSGLMMIGDRAFSGCTGLESINIDPDNAFYDSRDNCNAIIRTQINYLIKGCINTIIPNSVTSIGYGAFEGCSGLTSVNIPNSVTSIDGRAFQGCSGLTSVNIPNSVTSIGPNAFRGCSGLTLVNIPNSVTTIGESAFEGCSGLTSLVIPSSVTSIGEYAFSGCSGLESIIVDSGNAFYDSRDNCNSIIKTKTNYLITGCNNSIIPNSVRSIGPNAFFGCSGLTSVNIPNSVTSIGSGAFQGCSGLTSVTIGNGVTEIADYMFQGCSGLPSITIPNSVIRIRSGAFYDCSGLTSVNIPNSVIGIGDGVFEGCSSLTSITIPNSVKDISPSFSGCTRLESINVDSGNTVYDSRDNCNAIIETKTNLLIIGCKNTIIPNSVTGIGYGAFQGCSGLTSITIPNSVIIIRSRAFYDCSGLTLVNIPNSVTSIEERTFSECSKIKTITLGSGIKSIAYVAFSNCPELTDVYCYADKVPSTSVDAFYGSNVEYATLHVPTESVNAYKVSKPWRNFKEIVALPRAQYKLIYYVDNEIYKTYTVNEGDAIIPEPAPIKEGYTFSGWSEIPETMPAHDVTVMGTFTINKYKLTYTLDGELYKTYDVEYGTTITPEPAPTKEGYTFSGWSWIPTKMPAEDVTVTGSFTVNKYKLIYKIDGAEYKSYEVEFGETITPEAEPTKEGYTFSGWSWIPTKMPAEDVTVTGSFTVNKYKLIYKVDGAEYKSYEVEFGVTITPEAEPTKEGYTFSGWSWIPTKMPAEDVTVTGSFTVNQYTITYIIDNEVYTTQTVDYGSTIIPPAAPEREGYDFAWGDYPETMPAYDITIYGTYTTGIEAIMVNEVNCQIFSLDGKTLNEPQKGVNIVRMSNGQVRKVVVK